MESNPKLWLPLHHYWPISSLVFSLTLKFPTRTPFFSPKSFLSDWFPIRNRFLNIICCILIFIFYSPYHIGYQNLSNPHFKVLFWNMFSNNLTVTVLLRTLFFIFHICFCGLVRIFTAFFYFVLFTSSLSSHCLHLAQRKFTWMP